MSTTTLDVIVGAKRVEGQLGASLDTSYATTYNLSSRVDYIHIGNDGFGLPEFERFVDSGPLQDGSSDRGYLLNPRKVQLVLNTVATSALEYWQLREQLIHIFMPRNYPLILKFTTPLRTYYLDCYTEGGLTFPSTDKQANIGHKITIQLVAPDPLFTTGTSATQITLLYETSSNTATGTAQGNYYAPCYILGYSTLGSWSNPYIRVREYPNSATSPIERILQFSGLTIPINHIVVINTRYGAMSVNQYDGSFVFVANLINYLSTSSDLSTFGVYPNGSGVTRTYEFYTYVTAGSPRIGLYYYPRYIGL